MYGRPTKLIAYPQISRVGHAAQMPTLATGTNVPMLEEQTLTPGGDVVLASAEVAQPGLVEQPGLVRSVVKSVSASKGPLLAVVAAAVVITYALERRQSRGKR